LSKSSFGITNDFLFEVRDLLGNKDDSLSVDYTKNNEFLHLKYTVSCAKFAHFA